GARATAHRGPKIPGWADLAVPAEAHPSTPAWETKAWREARARLARRREAARARPPLPEAVPIPEPLASEDGAAPAANSAGPRAPAEGNAEEWLGAVPSSLAPAPAAPPPAQRIRLCYRKRGPARLI